MLKENRKYFAAANTYNGFVSYFSDIFKPDEYERIYVIKGGPGTGKSSLMRNIVSCFNDKAEEIQEIYCSSDPNSLDGIIIKNKGKKVAIIDGTAPHEKDTVYPGVIDEIIYLGENWDSRFLLGQKETILSINKGKAEAYRTAYSYLSQAGKAAEFIKDVHYTKFNKLKAKNKAEELFSSINCSGKGKITPRLLSSFGKYGNYNLTFKSDKLISLSNNTFCSNIILNCFSEYLISKGYSFYRFLHVLSPSDTDAIFIKEAKTIITKNDIPDIASEEYFNLTPYDFERMKCAYTIHDMALEEAKRWFNIASDLHFRLEELYSSAMDFTKNNDILLKKSEEIRTILDL